MFQWLRVAALAPLLVLTTGACDASQKELGDKAGQQAAAEPSTNQQAASNPGTTMTNEQVPLNQQFSSLDEYLTYLERMQGPVDGPWYKQIGPGLYELQTGNLRTLTPDEGKRTFTRQELMKQFGFSK